MTSPTPEESAAIVAALGLFDAAGAREDSASAAAPGTSRWRQAGRLYGALEGARFTAGASRERRS